MTHGHELWGGMWEGGGGQDGVEWGGNGTTVIAQSINIFKKNRNFRMASTHVYDKMTLWNFNYKVIKIITCTVFPSPISSPRIHPLPWMKCP